MGTGQLSRQIRSLDQRRDAQEFEHLPLLTTGADRLIQLGEIADVTTRPVIGQPYATQGGVPIVQMMVMKNADSDTMQAAELLKTWVDEVGPTLPEGVTVSLFLEVWKFIRDELDLIMKNGIGGLILVIAALLVFLQFRVAMWVMLGMPVTFLAALLFFYYLGGSLNVLSLIAIVMALGIVVDDAIVVGEEAVTHFQKGASPEVAAVEGARRMFFPVIASSLTTLCAFLPLLGSGDNPIYEIPLMMLCVIAASLIECFLILPGHLREAFEKERDKKPSRFHQWFNNGFERFREERFRPVVRFAMQNRRIVIGSAVSLFVVSLTMWMTGWIRTEMSLNISFDQINADVQFVAGTTDEQRAEFVRYLESELEATNQANGGNNVVNYTANFNTATVNNEQKTGAQYANIWLELISPEQREITAAEFASNWLGRVKQNYLVDSMTIQKSSHYWGDFSILLKGADADTLKRAATLAIAELSTLDGVTNVHDDLPYGKEQWIFELTTEGRSLGLTTAGVGQQLRAAYDGQRIQIFEQDESEMEVRLILPEWERTNLASLGQFPIKTPSGQMIPLSNVATWEGKRGLDVIRHHNTARTIQVTGNVDIKKISGGEVVKYFNENLKERLSDEFGITVGFDGITLEEQEAASDFATQYLIALALIYIILAWVFASYSWPLAVMAAIPLGLTGALLGHFVMGMVIGPMSMLGLFTLTGIIVNDSIILVSTYQHLLKEGLSAEQAIEDAVCGRLRAVILTSVTTIAGLFPLLLEQAPMAAAFTPLAAAICFGMLYGTVLVLLVVPALLSSMITINGWIQNKRGRKDEISATQFA